MTLSKNKMTAQVNDWIEQQQIASARLQQAILGDPVVKAYLDYRMYTNLIAARFASADGAGGTDVDRDALRSFAKPPATPLVHADFLPTVPVGANPSVVGANPRFAVLAAKMTDDDGSLVNQPTSAPYSYGYSRRIHGFLRDEHSGGATPSLLAVLMGVIDAELTRRNADVAATSTWQNALAT